MCLVLLKARTRGTGGGAARSCVCKWAVVEGGGREMAAIIARSLFPLCAARNARRGLLTDALL